jgi:DNA (cytosine-5)-methyltransferase 1
MKTPQFLLPLAHELVVDLFAGGGGASTGIEAAIGRHVDIAVNHDPEAISLHEANHPQTRHFISDVFEVDPITVTNGQPVGALWASPDCKHFSKAKGGTPVSKKIRGLAWVVVKWAKAVKPRVIFLENVEEFQTWGPLGEDDRPCPVRKGETFRQWVGELEALGYRVEWRELRACDYGAPTIRKRLFLVARRDGLPVVWPEPTHAKPDAKGKAPKGLKPWRTAAECIDWSIPCPSIFERKKPLADATCRRIAKGLVRYVIEAGKPFIVSIANWTSESVRSGGQPLSTVTANPKGGHHALVVPTLVQTGYGERPGQAPRVPGLEKPLGTVVAGQKHALVSAFLAKHYTGVVGSDLTNPIGTVTSVDHHSLVTANLVHMGHGEGKAGGPVTEPLHTISAQGLHHGEVRAFLVKYYSEGGQDQSLHDPMHTIPTKDRLGLVTVTIAGQEWVIVDIGLRMLNPKELYAAQGFPAHYRFETGADGEPMTKTAQVRMCGNSVSPPPAEALVRANYSEIAEGRIAA